MWIPTLKLKQDVDSKRLFVHPQRGRNGVDESKDKKFPTQQDNCVSSAVSIKQSF